MTIHEVFCVKLNKEAEGLPRPPYKDEFGKKIYENISQEAWALWLKRQTMFINENRLNVTEKAAKDFLKIECEKFLFTDEDNKPEGYQPEN